MTNMPNNISKIAKNIKHYQTILDKRKNTKPPNYQTIFVE